MIQPPQPRDAGLGDGQKMVQSARAVQRDEAETEDAESHELVRLASPLLSRTSNAIKASKTPTRWVSPLMGSRNLLFIPSRVSLPKGNYQSIVHHQGYVRPDDRCSAPRSYNVSHMNVRGAWQSGRMRWS